MKQVILFGNGINRLSGEEFEWYNLLQRLLKSGEHMLIKEEEKKDDKDKAKIAYTHVFNDIEFNDKYKYEVDNETSKRLTLKELARKELEKNELKSTSEDVYKRLMGLDVEDYLTTNYDGHFERYLKKCGYKKSRNSDSSYYISAHRKYYYEKGSDQKKLWPIHGDFRKQNTMMFGFDHYCTSLSSIVHYLSQGSTRHDGYIDHDINGYKRWRHNHKGAYINYKVDKGQRNEHTDFWADFFFLADVHIIGLGMDLSEIDLWMLLSRRMQFLRSKRVNNKIYCYGYFEKDVKVLLEAYSIDVIEDDPKEDWNKHYERLIDKMTGNINERKQ